MREINNVGVVGSGTMGRGIAQLAAQNEFNVVLRDIEEEIVEDAMEEIESNLKKAVKKDIMSEKEADNAFEKIQSTVELDILSEKSDIIIECVPEVMDLKQDVFERLDRDTDNDVILASNTSSMSISEIMKNTENPERTIGLHFFNPAYIIKLLEIIMTRNTDEDTVEQAVQFAEDLDRKPVTINDRPGFVSTRLSMALSFEAAKMVEEGVATPEKIDEIMETGYNHAMGPLRTGDLVGWDVRDHIGEYLFQEYGERHLKPPMIVKNMVRSGELGKKTGKGFYDWDEE